MTDGVTMKSKYLEVPQELRDRLIKLYNASKTYKRTSKQYSQVRADDIDYKGIRQEVKMAAIRTEEVRRRMQIELTNLEEVREYVKAMQESSKDRLKDELLEMLKKELKQGERKLVELEERINLTLSPERDANVLQSIQECINRLSERMEQLK
ncbi:hypothetical protein NEDG_01210 [Nematocida displodere]|uniref:Uncharacterized protein n=1 Tax=Nematocida displodere TaxID=1805483 RepID=A0A177EC34_9MICR|nr:hypothetical protein NEDG_01210 [Nematocida displodere]